MIIFINDKTTEQTTSSKPLTQPAINLSFKCKKSTRGYDILVLYGLKYSVVSLF